MHHQFITIACLTYLQVSHKQINVKNFAKFSCLENYHLYGIVDTLGSKRIYPYYYTEFKFNSTCDLASKNGPNGHTKIDHCIFSYQYEIFTGNVEFNKEAFAVLHTADEIYVPFYD